MRRYGLKEAQRFSVLRCHLLGPSPCSKTLALPGRHFIIAKVIVDSSTLWASMSSSVSSNDYHKMEKAIPPSTNFTIQAEPSVDSLAPPKSCLHTCCMIILRFPKNKRKMKRQYQEKSRRDPISVGQWRKRIYIYI